MLFCLLIALGLAGIAALVLKQIIGAYKNFDLKYYNSEVDIFDSILSPDYKLLVPLSKLKVYLRPLSYRDHLHLEILYPKLSDALQKINAVEDRTIFLECPKQEHEYIVHYCATLISLAHYKNTVLDFEEHFYLLKKCKLVEIIYILNKYKNLINTDNLYIGRCSLGNFGGGNTAQNIHKYDFIDTLASEYGFTLEQVLNFTLPQISLYLKLLGKRNVREYERQKASAAKRTSRRAR